MTPQHESSPNCPSAGRTITRLLLSFLILASPSSAASSTPDTWQHAVHLQQPPVMGPGPLIPEAMDRPNHESTHIFTLRNIFHHGTYLYPGLHRRKDVINEEAASWRINEDDIIQDSPPLIARSRSTKVERLRDRRPSVVDPMIAAARENGEVWALSPSAWSVDEISGPNITDKDTIITFARMAADAYVRVPFTEDWEDVNPDFDSGADFGWEGDGLRGHVFADENNSTIVIALKGTSLALWDGAETTTNDKENDNLFFSCCCAQQGQLTWRKVCDCATSTYTCNSTCLVKNLKKENRYYQAARHLYSNVTALYPDSNVWVTGHSLGGAVSSLIGLTYGLPTVTFEAPGQALAAKRLGLPAPPGSDPDFPQTRQFTGVYNFGHTADPIYLGTCNGATGSCTYYGYAMETTCHAGYECVYDVASDKGWRVGIGTHRIHVVINDVLKKYDTVPECITTPECQDCALWKWFESNSSDPTTSSSSSSTRTRTRTETCKTPGWWGCLDETTTGTATTTRRVTTTTSTSTCKTPGWFGCYDKTTTTTSATTTLTPTKTSTASTSCESPGWWGGCNDPTQTTSLSPTSSKECKTPGMFYGCKDATTATSIPHPITSPPVMPSSTVRPSATKHHECKSKEWFGLICADSPATGTATGITTSIPTSVAKGLPQQPKCRRRSWLGYCKEWSDVSEGPVTEI